MRVSFHGAAGEVTGSCHLVECNGRRILVDCGLFQGEREAEEENERDFGFDAESIDFLLLTHAHLDHCGRIPLLRKSGFSGEIISTTPTRELARLVLLDSANLNEEEHGRRLRHHRYGRSEADVREPLYGVIDAMESFECFGRSASYGQTIEVCPGVRATFNDAGHILGSAWIRLDLEEKGKRRSIVFSGDLGSSGRPLLRDPQKPAKTDYLVTETTYGDRNHKDLGGSLKELYLAIGETHRKGGNAIIPTFALDRAQEVLYFLREGEQQGLIPKGISVFVDSPMAITATRIYQRYPDFYRPEVRDIFRHGRDPFHASGLVMVRETAESIALNRVDGAVILAGSGMCTGGRVRHHLAHNIGRGNSSVIFVGYAARGTLARRIVDGAHSVRIFDRDYPVRAAIHTINGFSAHADRRELLDWQGDAHPDVTFLVHGEPESMESFGAGLKETQVRLPRMHEAFEL